MTSTSRNPNADAALAAFWAATVAAKADDLREPLYPEVPAEAHAITFPAGSVMVIMVLLKVADTCATPEDTCRRVFFLTFVPFFGVGCFDKVSTPMRYFFLFATVLRRPLRVLALVEVR